MAGALSLALVITSLYVYVARINQDLNTAHLQRGATDYIVQLNDVILGLQQIRGLGQIARHGDATATQELQSANTRTLARIQKLARNPLSPSLQTLPSLTRLHQGLLEHGTGIHESVDAETDFAILTDLIAQTEHALLHRVMRQATLPHEHEQDEYDLADLLIHHIVPLSEQIGQLRGRYSGLLAAGSADSVQDDLLLSHRHLIATALDELELLWDSPMLRNHNDGLAPSFARAITTTREFINLTPLDPPLPAMALFRLGSTAIEHWGLLSRQITEALDQRTGDREARLVAQNFVGGSISVLALLPMVFATAFFYRRHRRALSQLLVQHQEMERLSQIDSLTGLYNRRPLAKMFSNERRRALREGHGLAFAILDVDHFKHYNDSYGHQAGDEALASVAAVMRSGLQRAGDHLFRMGGEEFCYLHACAAGQDGKEAAERLRELVAQAPLKQGWVTVSIGVCYLDHCDHLDMDQAIKCADDALYRAKHAGRNRVELILGATAQEKTDAG